MSVLACTVPAKSLATPPPAINVTFSELCGANHVKDRNLFFYKKSQTNFLLRLLFSIFFFTVSLNLANIWVNFPHNFEFVKLFCIIWEIWDLLLKNKFLSFTWFALQRSEKVTFIEGGG